MELEANTFNVLMGEAKGGEGILGNGKVKEFGNQLFPQCLGISKLGFEDADDDGVVVVGRRVSIHSFSGNGIFG